MKTGLVLEGGGMRGIYTVGALQMMVHIVENTEEHLDYEMILRKSEEHRKIGRAHV